MGPFCSTVSLNSRSIELSFNYNANGQPECCGTFKGPKIANHRTVLSTRAALRLIYKLRLHPTHTTFSARSSPYPHQTAWPPQASSSIYPTLKRSHVFPVSCIEPCFLLSSPRSVFPIGFSIHLTLFPQQLSQSRSLFI